MVQSSQQDEHGIDPLLRVVDLSVRYKTGSSTLQAVSHVSFALVLGEVLGVVGESGCGKSTLVRAVLRLLPRTAYISGEVLLNGRDLLACSKRELRQVRSAEASIVFQDAMNALNPVLRVRKQLVEKIRLHDKVTRRQAEVRAAQLVEMVGLEDRVLGRYPHELSGGMRQRICIAMAFASEPSLVLADEPTTALDVLTQDRVISKMLELRSSGDQAMIFISHDIALVSEISDTIGVMYAGHLVEFGSVRQILYESAHPYTMGLLNAFPRADVDLEVVSIPGVTPRFREAPNHCPFTERCPFSQPICLEEAPPHLEVSPGHWAACHFAGNAAEFRERAPDPRTWRPDTA